MSDNTDNEMRNIVRDAHQWIDAEVQDPKKTKDDVAKLIECMQEVVQEHFDQQQSDLFYTQLMQLVNNVENR